MGKIVDIRTGGSERGEASILIELSDGIVTVKHGDFGDLLLKTSVEDGFWNTLWAYLETGGKTIYRNQSVAIDKGDENE
jgi:hypothetical protein